MTTPAIDTVTTSDIPPMKRLALFILEIRKTILVLGLAIAAGTIGFYFLSPQLFHIIQGHLDQKLAFFTVAEPFLAHVKLALCITLFVLMPWIIFIFWRALSKPFSLSQKAVINFVFFTCCLFYTGSLFCYFVTLPFGVKFLLGFESQELQSVISVGKFVSFVTIFVLAFGLIFELPIFMVFSSKVGIINRQSFAQNRRYALLFISIVAALLTPTPDIINMLLMGGPLYLLYEAGIFILSFIEKKPGKC
ncbi:MAG: twin-arginine translocase subunit TatC [Desulfobulbaceae bacterium]|uniref:Sec-independent protein translocase protein TatC n=1 Tax=Candidatus Desulfobia pelagia TaxID=2841692 RepID=A0A8J6TFC2_9BACT|nr:twin-arginine translocase subunit TatC [Candidatus Desulfobia pelagia]